MQPISLASSGFELVTKRTRKRVFLDEMNLVVPWRELVGLIQPFAPTGTGAKGGRPTFALETMLRIHFLQQWFGFTKVRYKGLAKNTAQLMTLFALSTVWMARRHLLGARG
jgi:hypothetical protein